MINRGNWLRVKEYLEYRENVGQLSAGSLRVEKTYLRHILEWAADRSFRDVEGKRPTLPDHMLSARLDGSDEQLSANYIKKTLATARRFFRWLADHQRDYRSIKNTWIDTLRPRRLPQKASTVQAVSLDEILAIARAPAKDLIEERIRAAAAFLYLSGMRIGAFVSLPVEAVDIESGSIKQFPELGVRTKNSKRAKTYLLQIPELLKIVSDWDSTIRAVLPPEGFWFAPLSPETGEIDPEITVIGKHRVSLARRNLHSWLRRVELPYRNPHAFRHGHIQFLMDRANNVKEFKAASMNVMHESISTTDRIYSRLKGDEVQSKVVDLSKRGSTKDDLDLELERYRKFLEWQKQQS